jgi:hypothetical protein
MNIEHVRSKEKLTIAKRTRFFGRVVSYFARLTKAAVRCKFNKIKAEDEIILIKLIFEAFNHLK